MSGISLKTVGLLFLLILIVVAVIDYLMGTSAQALNAYEIIRRSLPEGLGLREVTPVYIIGQERAGDWALAWAWLAYLCWAGLWTVILLLSYQLLRQHTIRTNDRNQL
jgi:hypothetical protein